MATRTDDFSGTLSNFTPYANAGDWSISGGALVFSPAFSRNNNAALRWTGAAMDSADYAVEVTLTKSADNFKGPGPAVRLQSGSLSGYAIQWYGDAGYLVEITSGSEATLGATFGSPSTATVTLRLECEGSTLRAYVNGTLVRTVTDATYATGAPGISVGDYDGGSVTFDNWSAADLASGSNYSVVSNVTLTSSTPDNAVLGVSRSLTSATSVTSVTTDTATLSVVRSASSSVQISSTTPDDAVLGVSRGLTSSLSWTSSTPDDVVLALGDYALRFYGNNLGTGTTGIDRVMLPLEDGASPTAIDLGDDFTYEVWLRCQYADNTSSATGQDARYSNIFLDRDIWGDPSGYVAGVTRDGSDLVVCFGVAGGGSWTTIYGSTNVGDDSWHHIALVRTRSTGVVRLFVDGVQDASGTFTTGDLSFAASGGGGGSPNDSDPFLVLGAEKHDADPSVYRSYNGYMDELRISDNARYTTGFTPPTAAFTADGDTVALYHFDDGSGTTLTDSVGSVDGTLYVGGTNNGPAWVVSTLWTVAISISSSVAITSTTPDNGVLAVARSLTSVTSVTSVTTDTAILSVVRSIASSIGVDSQTPDDGVWGVARGLTSVTAITSTTPDNAVLGLAVLVSSAVGVTSATADDAILSVDRKIAASISVTSETPNDVVLGVMRVVISAISVTSVTTDTAILSVVREVSASVQISSATPDDATLITGATLYSSIAITSATPDDVALSVERSITGALVLTSSTPDDAVLGVARRLTSATSVASATPDDVVLAIGRAIAAAVAILSSTPDDATLTISTQTGISSSIAITSTTPDDGVLRVARGLTSSPSLASSTPDDAALSVVRSIASVVQVSSVTPDSAALGIDWLITAVISILSVTPDDVALNIETARGAVSVAFSGRKAGVTFTARKPSVTFSN